MLRSRTHRYASTVDATTPMRPISIRVRRTTTARVSMSCTAARYVCAHAALRVPTGCTHTVRAHTHTRVTVSRIDVRIAHAHTRAACSSPRTCKRGAYVMRAWSSIATLPLMACFAPAARPLTSFGFARAPRHTLTPTHVAPWYRLGAALRTRPPPTTTRLSR